MASPISDVPKDQVGEVVQGFIDDGLPEVNVTKDNGTYTVTPIDGASPRASRGLRGPTPAKKKKGRGKKR